MLKRKLQFSITSALILCSINISSCSIYQVLTKNSEANLELERNIDAPRGSFIKKKHNHKKSISYHIKINENLGHKRNEIEYSEVCTTIKKSINISWALSNLKGTKNFRTPIDIVSIYKDNEQIFSQRLADNILWNNFNDNRNDPIDNIVKSYPQKNPVLYNIGYNGNKLELWTDSKKTVIYSKGRHKICLGLRRLGMSRYKGKYVPAQSIEIRNIKHYDQVF